VLIRLELLDAVSQPDPGAATVLFDKNDSGILDDSPHRGECGAPWLNSLGLELAHAHNTYFGLLREVVRPHRYA
jgi:hypothetical protein